MVVDDDIVAEPECNDEEIGTGKNLGTETDEGDSVLADQSARSSGKTFSQSNHSINPQASVAGVIDGGQKENSDVGSCCMRVI